MKILIVEDIDLYAQALQEAVKRRLRREPVVTLVQTEEEFRRRFDELVSAKFDVAVFDVMIPWADFDHLDVDPPAEVTDELEGRAKWRGGLRCAQRFVAETKGKIPVYLFTVLSSQELQDDFAFGEIQLFTKDQLMELAHRLTHPT